MPSCRRPHHFQTPYHKHLSGFCQQRCAVHVVVAVLMCCVQCIRRMTMTVIRLVVQGATTTTTDCIQPSTMENGSHRGLLLCPTALLPPPCVTPLSCCMLCCAVAPRERWAAVTAQWCFGRHAHHRRRCAPATDPLSLSVCLGLALGLGLSAATNQRGVWLGAVSPEGSAMACRAELPSWSWLL